MTPGHSLIPGETLENHITHLHIIHFRPLQSRGHVSKLVPTFRHNRLASAAVTATPSLLGVQGESEGGGQTNCEGVMILH